MRALLAFSSIFPFLGGLLLGALAVWWLYLYLDPSSRSSSEYDYGYDSGYGTGDAGSGYGAGYAGQSYNREWGQPVYSTYDSYRYAGPFRQGATARPCGWRCGY